MKFAKTYSHEDCGFCLSVSHAKLNQIRSSGAGAHEAYFANQEMSLKLWVVISGIELTLRNRASSFLIAEFGAELFGSEAWRLGDAARSRIEKVIGRSRGSNLTIDALTTQLPFSFWTLLFSKRMESYCWPVLFQNLLTDSAPRTRGVLYARLQESLELRNRIAHHEVVLKAKYQGALERQLEVLSWICEDFRREAEDRINFSLQPVESQHEQ
jgi:hypothetical protein